MANKKISALTGATTPLAGTEVLPIVQSGTTVKVSVANLTAGRSIAASDVTIVGGNGGQLNLDNTGQQYTQITYKNNGVAKAYQFFDNTAAKLQTYSNTGIPFLFSPGGADSFEMSTAGNLDVKQAAKGVNFTANTPAAGMTSQLLNWYEEGTFTPSITSGATGVSYTTQSGHYTRIGRQVFYRINLVMSAATANGNAFKVGGLPFTCGQSGGGYFAYDNGAWTGSATTNMPMVFVGAGGTELTFFQGTGAQVVGTNLVNIATDNFYIVGQYMV